MIKMSGHDPFCTLFETSVQIMHAKIENPNHQKIIIKLKSILQKAAMHVLIKTFK